MNLQEAIERRKRQDAIAREAEKALDSVDFRVGPGSVNQSDNEKPISNFQCPRCGCNTIIEITDTLLNSKQLKCICERHSCDWER